MDFSTIKYALERPGRIIGMLGSKGWLNWMPDRMYLSLVFRLNLGYWPDFEVPKTFNEKLNWLKLYDRKPEYTRMVDKYAVREYIADKIGEDYLIPLVGGPWNSVEEIDFEALPEQFVLKTTHDSGGVVICRDKASFDVEGAKLELEKRLQRNFFWAGREWPYKNVKPRIIAEKYMQDGDNQALMDLKFFCFNGNPKLMYMAQEEVQDSPADYFDMKFTHLDLRIGTDPWAKQCPQKPPGFEKMEQLAKLVSEGVPQLRVDFYRVDGRIYFGEITFFHNGGYSKFIPDEWDDILGSWIELPQK